MDILKLIDMLGFSPKENTKNIYIKTINEYSLQINTDTQTIDYGKQIKCESKTTQNFNQAENEVVLECVIRLLERGYKPQNIILEKTWGAGHGNSGRLDICVTREDGSEYLLIECKNYGKEFDKEFTRMKKDGGQLFTYFKFSNKADILMLYASNLQSKPIAHRSEIVKIEEEYRAGDVKDFYNAWNKITKHEGVWENPPYDFKSKTFTKSDLQELTEDISKTIFHGFASILRKHSVSDKPNAFNKIFNLFLAKLYDEAKRDSDELEFYWKDSDDAVDFQVRLINLHKNGLYEFLKKEVEGIKDSDFEGYKSEEELKERKKKLLKFNNVFTIKEVFDDATFDENHRVLKDVVQLLQKYQIRYPRKQQHLSEFFEQLLTTGLKQEVGQYFTPPPVTKFIIRSLPIKKMMEQEINNEVPKLPAIIDYAAGSGHFITEALEEYQDIINAIDTKGFYPKAINQVKAWQADPYEWAAKYVYGIEKDYRLVKVAKVGCYFYGDGVAQIIHGDGLDSFATSKSYVGLLKENINIEDSSKAKFSVVVSNPPYSVNDCKDDLEYIKAEKEFTLYSSLSYKSKDIECLFVERTKHLLKDGGVASLILPSSILNSGGIQAKTREIILQYFDIVAIAELGKQTFMATGTNTVTLFLRRRSNKLSADWRKSVVISLETQNDITINGIEKPIAKYINHVWENISFDDYITLLNKNPNRKIEDHEIYKEYQKKLKVKASNEFWNILLAIEQDKLFYFIITLNQKVVLIRSGEKEAEKRFLGYEFSKRRNSEGMHAMQRGKSVDQCTLMYSSTKFNDETKASTYILKAFEGDYETPIHSSMQDHISRHSLVDMLTFDRFEFEKTISLSVKKKVKFETIWETEKLDFLGSIATIKKGTSITKERTIEGKIPVIAGGQEPAYYHNESNRDKNVITVSASGAYAGFVNYFETPIFASDCNTITSNDENKISTKLIFLFLKSIQNEIYSLQRGLAQPHVYGEDLSNIKIPLPSKGTQQKIVAEIEVIEASEKKAKMELKNSIIKIDELIISNTKVESKKLGEVCEMKAGKFVSAYDIKSKKETDLFPCYGGNGLRGYTKTYTHNGKFSLIGRQGALCGNICKVEGQFHATEHAVVVTPMPEINTDWLYYQLVKLNLNQYAKGTAQPGLSVENLKSVSIQVPSLSEQQKIVNQIEKIEKEVKALETRLSFFLVQKEAILKKYL